MAAFIAKQMVGDKLSSVKGAMGGEENNEEKKDGPTDEEQAELEEMRREVEEKRKEKHRKMEEERETMRQSIRDKYGIKKKEVPVEEPGMDGRIGRKKKSPAELAAEANADSDDDELQNKSGFPTNLDELQNKVSDLKNNVATSVSEVTEKCTVQ